MIELIENLTATAEAMGERNAQICLLVLSGALKGGDDGLLAAKMQEFAKDVLIPNLHKKKELEKANKN